MKPILAIIGFVFGALAGAYFGVQVSGSLLQRQEYVSPDQVSAQAELMLIAGMVICGLVGGLIGWGIASWMHRRSVARREAQES